MFRIYILVSLIVLLKAQGINLETNSELSEDFEKAQRLRMKYRSVVPYAAWDMYSPKDDFIKFYTAKSTFDYKNLEKTLSSPGESNYPEIFGIRKCLDPLQRAYKQDKGWILKLVDASGKLPPGYLKGTVNWIGSYDECIDISVSEIQNTTDSFKGLYCTVHFRLKTSLQPQQSLSAVTAICIPDICEDFLEYFFDLSSMVSKNRTFEVSKLTCNKNETKWSAAAIFYLFLLSVLLLFTFLGSLITAVDFYMKKATKEPSENILSQSSINIEITQISATTNNEKNHCAEDSTPDNSKGKDLGVTNDSANKPELITKKGYSKSLSFILDFLKCFCVFTNGAKILNTETKPNQMNCLHGIRFLSMSWVILGHTFAFIVGVMTNVLDLLDIVTDFGFQAILQALFSVDTFFFLSGFLLTFLFLKEANKREGKINWIFFYVHRIWRLTPTYMIVLGFFVVIFPNLGSGPFWNGSRVLATKDCPTMWWHNLLYINNLFDRLNECMVWSWYLANDMQFYIISPIFLYFLWRKRVIGISIIGVFLLICWISAGVLTHKYKLIPLVSDIYKYGANVNTEQLMAQENLSFDTIYSKPWTRIGPYLIGALVAYLLHITGERKKFLTIWQQSIGWGLAAIFCLSVVYGPYKVVMSVSTAAAYNSLSRTVWALGLGWVVYACVTGHGGPVNDFLSWKFWIPLSRLTYCAYLVHPIIMFWFYQSLKTGVYFTYFNLVTYFFAFLLYSYMAALATTLIAESPMMAIEKLLLSPKKN